MKTTTLVGLVFLLAGISGCSDLLSLATGQCSSRAEDIIAFMKDEVLPDIDKNLIQAIEPVDQCDDGVEEPALYVVMNPGVTLGQATQGFKTPPWEKPNPKEFRKWSVEDIIGVKSTADRTIVLEAGSNPSDPKVYLRFESFPTKVPKE